MCSHPENSSSRHILLQNMESCAQNHSRIAVATLLLTNVEISRPTTATVAATTGNVPVNVMRPFVSPVTVLFVSVLLGLCVAYNRRRARMVRLIGKLPGPVSMPILGNMIECSVQHDGEWPSALTE